MKKRSETRRIFVSLFQFYALKMKNMEKVIINSYEDFEKLVGQQIGVSEWLEVSQERINQFADATVDSCGCGTRQGGKSV